MSWCGEALQEAYGYIQDAWLAPVTQPRSFAGASFLHEVHHAGSADKRLPSACPSRNHSESTFSAHEGASPLAMSTEVESKYWTKPAPMLDFLYG
jgi:hypothetical protein